MMMMFCSASSQELKVGSGKNLHMWSHPEQVENTDRLQILQKSADLVRRREAAVFSQTVSNSS